MGDYLKGAKRWRVARGWMDVHVRSEGACVWEGEGRSEQLEAHVLLRVVREPRDCPPVGYMG